MAKYGHLTLLAFLSFVVLLDQVQSHGMMLEPVGRASRWRFNNTAPKNYDDNGLFCGGFNKQWNVNKGKCGLCGDDYSLRTPRPHEMGGKYGEGVIVRTYKSGNLIPVGVKLTANHKGYFYFNLCNLDKSKENEECYEKYNLKLINGQYKFYLKSTSPGWFNTTLQLPKDVSCKHCVLRWTYYAGNSWGICPNGTGAVGCGPQENFRSCADIEITNKDKRIQKPLFFFSDEDNDLKGTKEDDNEEMFLSYSDEIEYTLSVDESPANDIRRKKTETREEILNKIKKLFLQIFNEEQYAEIEKTIEKFDISDD